MNKCISTKYFNDLHFFQLNIVLCIMAMHVSCRAKAGDPDFSILRYMFHKLCKNLTTDCALHFLWEVEFKFFNIHYFT